jgi:bifunctional non-homologous end joining protein LigD
MLWRTTWAPKRQPPGFIEPCLPTRVDKPPTEPQWVHEIKHDGYRLIARKRDGCVRLFTRRGYDWTERFPLITEALAAMRANAIVIDGEAVVCDGDGVAIFDKLHSQAHNDQVFLYAFDLLELGGLDYRPQPLLARKAKLKSLLAKVPAGIRFNDHITGDGAMIFRHGCKLGFEGIVSKHAEHPYRSGPSRAWLKIKNPNAPAALRFRDDEP